MSVGPTRFARKYVESQPEPYRTLIWSLLDGLPPTLEYHKSDDYLWLCYQGDQTWLVYVRRKRLGRSVDVIFNTSADAPTSVAGGEESCFARLQSSGCPRPQRKYADWPKQDYVACSLGKEATEDEIAAVRDFIRWYLTEDG